MFTSAAIVNADQLPFIPTLQSSNPVLGDSLATSNTNNAWPLPSDLTPVLCSSAISCAVEPNSIVKAPISLPIDFPFNSDSLVPLNPPGLMSPNSSNASFAGNSNYDDDREEEEDDDDDEVDDAILSLPTARPLSAKQRQWLEHQYTPARTSLGDVVHHYIPQSTNAMINLPKSYQQLAQNTVSHQEQCFEQRQGDSYSNMLPFQPQAQFTDVHTQQQHQSHQQQEQPEKHHHHHHQQQQLDQQKQHLQHSAEVTIPAQFEALQHQLHPFSCPTTNTGDFFSGVLHAFESTTTESVGASMTGMAFEMPSMVSSVSSTEYPPFDCSTATTTANTLLAVPSAMQGVSVAVAPSISAPVLVDTSSSAMGGLSWMSLSSPPSPSGRVRPAHRKSAIQQRHNRSTSAISTFSLEAAYSSAPTTVTGLPVVMSMNAGGSSGSALNNSVVEPDSLSSTTTAVVKNEGELQAGKAKSKRAYRVKLPRSKQTATEYVCKVPKCGKKFSRAYNLTSHMKTHSAERPFPCGPLQGVMIASDTVAYTLARSPMFARTASLDLCATTNCTDTSGYALPPTLNR
ncbi:hypothetical protein BGW41_006013 [Actinomortierella wolfii]|nr:hypothetical protein BGW41_006013 [Actinomortierella wolfii]